MPIAVRDIVYEFTKDMKKLFGSQLCSVVLYGSYARGNYNENSDVDVMILVKTSEGEIEKYLEQVSDCAFEYMMKYGIDISPVIKNEEHFNYWVENLPYYRNVKKEGVVVNAE